MSKRNSKLIYYENESILALYYVKAVYNVYGIIISVSKDNIPLFKVLEDDLRDKGISYKDYANTVCGVLQNWCVKQRLRFPPANVFLSDFAIKRYESVKSKETVEYIQDGGEVLYSELMVARKYIQDNLSSHARFRDVVSSLEPLLSPKWLDLYNTGSKRPVNDALEILIEEFGVEARDYVSLLDALR
jgi:hypothetical protein